VENRSTGQNQSALKIAVAMRANRSHREVEAALRISRCSHNDGGTATDHYKQIIYRQLLTASNGSSLVNIEAPLPRLAQYANLLLIAERWHMHSKNDPVLGPV